jgi:hypothetical protein
VDIALDDRQTIYWELLKRNLETRRLIVLSTLGLVTAFGAIVINDVLSGTDILDYYDCDFTRKALTFAGATVFAWAVFLAAVIRISRSIDALVHEIGVPGEIFQPLGHFYLIKSIRRERRWARNSSTLSDLDRIQSHFFNAGFVLPIVLSFGIVLGIILPLEQNNSLKIMGSWFGLADAPTDHPECTASNSTKPTHVIIDPFSRPHE